MSLLDWLYALEQERALSWPKNFKFMAPRDAGDRVDRWFRSIHWRLGGDRFTGFGVETTGGLLALWHPADEPEPAVVYFGPDKARFLIAESLPRFLHYLAAGRVWEGNTWRAVRVDAAGKEVLLAFQQRVVKRIGPPLEGAMPDYARWLALGGATEDGPWYRSLLDKLHQAASTDPALALERLRAIADGPNEVGAEVHETVAIWALEQGRYQVAIEAAHRAKGAGSVTADALLELAHNRGALS